jgi:hypothetical protein
LEANTVYASATPPSYSPNGRYAILKLGIPWSMHSSVIFFLFERDGDSWKPRVVDAQFLV